MWPRPVPEGLLLERGRMGDARPVIVARESRRGRQPGRLSSGPLGRRTFTKHSRSPLHQIRPAPVPLSLRPSEA